MSTLKPWYKAILIALLAGTMIVGVALGAGSATLRNYQVDFVEVTGTGISHVWTYAITASGDESAALSDWTLSIDDRCGYKFTSPPGSASGVRSYTTLTSYIMQDGTDFCDTHTCQEANYEVHKSLDSIAEQRRITFQNADNPLASSNPVTHLFQMTVGSITFSDHRIGDTGVYLDTGTGSPATGVISGAVCPPTAVSLVNLSASSSNTQQYLAVVIGISLAVIGWVGYNIRRKKLA